MEEGGNSKGGCTVRELLLTVMAVALVAGGLYLASRINGCGGWYWFLPLAQLVGGAAIIGYSELWPVRALGGLAVTCSFPVAFVVLVCGGLGPG